MTDRIRLSLTVLTCGVALAACSDLTTFCAQEQETGSVQEKETGPIQGTIYKTATELYGPLHVQEGTFTEKATIKPWSSYWFPSSDDFLWAVRDGKPSPLERYDAYSGQVLNQPTSAVGYERDHLYDSTAEGWAGRCGAWALASILAPEPSQPVDCGGVHFRVADLKALLVESFDNVDGLSQIGVSNKGHWDDVYTDIAPDQLHRIIQAELFQKRLPFIIDSDPGIEVWNTPIYDVKTTVTRDNARTDLVHVHTLLGGASLHVTDLDATGTIEEWHDYTYDLHGAWDQSDFLVTSGEWTDRSRQDHPDNVLLKPITWQRTSLNPEVRVATVQGLLECPPAPDAPVDPTPTSSVVTSTAWKLTTTPPAAGWQNNGFNDDAWVSATDEGQLPTGPWANIAMPSGSAAHWIWSYDSRSSSDTTTAYFRKTFVAARSSYTLYITADNSFTAYINGSAVGSGAGWGNVYTFNVSTTIGNSYALAVQVGNAGGPGGLIADLRSPPDGSSQANAGMSCASIVSLLPGAATGLYWIDPNGGDTSDAFQVYCDMVTNGGGWTVFPQSMIGTLPLDPEAFRADKKQAMVYFSNASGSAQYYTLLAELSNYPSSNLSVTQSTSNRLTVQFVPNVVKGTTNGFRSNDQDFPFINCDVNPMSQFNFFKTGVSDAGPFEFALTAQWIASKRVLVQTIPAAFFGNTTMYMGGCGAYSGNSTWKAVDGVVSACLGLR